LETNRAGATCGATYAQRGPYAAGTAARRLRCVRRLNIAARNLGSFQIRGHNGVMSPIYPKGGNSAADPAQPRGLNTPTDRRLQARARFDA